MSRDNRLFLVACKRPATEDSVRSNIRGAIRQLNKNLENASEDTFGVVAISLSRVLNPGTSVWSGDVEHLGHLLTRLMSSYREYWRAFDADPRICSILLHVATPSRMAPGVDLARMTYSIAGPLREVSLGTAIFRDHILEIKARQL